MEQIRTNMAVVQRKLGRDQGCTMPANKKLSLDVVSTSSTVHLFRLLRVLTRS